MSCLYNYYIVQVSRDEVGKNSSLTKAGRVGGWDNIKGQLHLQDSESELADHKEWS